MGQNLLRKGADAGENTATAGARSGQFPCKGDRLESHDEGTVSALLTYGRYLSARSRGAMHRRRFGSLEEVAMDIRWITPAGVEQIPDGELRVYAGRTDGVTWVHLNYDDEPGMATLVDMIKPRKTDLRDVSTRSPVPKLHLYPDHHFSAISGLARGSDGLLHFQPLKTFLTPQVLWTVFGPATASLTPTAINADLELVREELADHEVCPTTAFELITVIRRVMMQGQEDLIAAGARRIADLEGRVMETDPVTAEAVLQDLFELRHDLQTIRINAAQAYELYDNQLETQTLIAE